MGRESCGEDSKNYFKIKNMKNSIKLSRYIKGKLTALNPFIFFARLYIRHLNKREFLNPPFNIFNERPVEYKFVFDQIAKFYPKKVLDVGTGLTALPHLMANCGCSVVAIDNIKDYWPMGVFNRHYYIINEDIVYPKLKDRFDLITCISTLEHIENFNKAVGSMFSLLNSGGFLILTLPYNENNFVDNVYALSNSNVMGKLPPFKTHVFSRKEIEGWLKEGATIVTQEYWQFYTGDFWTTGERLLLPKSVTKNDKHQISCILFKKLEA